MLSLLVLMFGLRQNLVNFLLGQLADYTSLYGLVGFLRNDVFGHQPSFAAERTGCDYLVGFSIADTGKLLQLFLCRAIDVD